MGSTQTIEVTANDETALSGDAAYRSFRHVSSTSEP